MRPNRYSLLTIFFFSCQLLLAQDWKTIYDKSIGDYNNQNYAEALAGAKKALELSKNLSPKNEAYSAQLITVICVESNQPDEGLQVIAIETNYFKAQEGSTTTNYGESLRKHALLLQQKGALKEAELKCAEAVEAIRLSAGDQSLAHGSAHLLLGQFRVLNRRLQEAKEPLEKSLTILIQHPEGAEDYITALLLSADLDKQMNDLAGADTKYRKLIALLDQNNLQNLPEYTQAKSALADIALKSGNQTETAQLLQGSEISNEQKAQQFLKLAINYQNANDWTKAKDAYSQAEKAVQDGRLENNTAYSIQLNFGRALADHGLPDEALTRLTAAEALAIKLFGAGSGEESMANYALGDLSLLGGDINGAIRRYEKAGVGSKKIPEELRLSFASRAARKLLIQNRINASKAVLQPLVQEPSFLVTKPHGLDALIIFTEAQLLLQEVQPAIAILTKNLTTVGLKRDQKVRLEIQLAEAYKSGGQWQKATELLTAASADPEVSGALKAELYFQKAQLHQQLGNFVAAEKEYKSALEEYQKSGEKSETTLTRVANSLAILYTQLGNYAEAETSYLGLLKRTEQDAGLHSTVKQNLATVYTETLRYKEAEKLLEEVVAADRQRLGDQHPDYGVSLQNLAAVYQKTDQLKKAQELYEKALKIDQIALGENSLSYATKAANLGVVNEELENYPEALRLFEMALKIRGEKLGKEHPDYAFNEYNLAVLYQRLGQIDKAYPLFSHVAKFYTGQINEFFPAMSEKEKTAFFNKINEVIIAYQDFGIEHGASQKNLLGELFDFRLATKALLLSSSTKVRNRILSSGDAALLQTFAEWIKSKEELGKLFTLSLEEKEANKARILALQQKANDLEKKLSTQSELFARDNTQELVTWQKVKAQLKPGEAAVEMIRQQLNLKNDSVIYAALVLKPELPEPVLVVFPNGRLMETKEFSFYRNSIKFQMADPRSYDHFWKPLERLMTDVNTVYFSPDGVYNKVNIMTLYNPATSKYMIELFNIKLLSNTREIVSAPRKVDAPTTATLLGSPDFRLGALSGGAHTNASSNSTTRAIVGNGIPDLPGTLVEVDKINQLLKGTSLNTQLYTAADASESAIKGQVNPSILHIATHGFFVPSEDEEAPVVLSQDLAQASNNPLLRSGLILSGAEKYLLEPSSNAGEDGILTAYEAMNLSLDKTDLVVLSACETGAGEIRNGEGVYGLQRSFLIAGANSLLMSLWKVDDTATQELMVEFYNLWNTSKNKSNSFRNTQLALMKKYKDPYYWGSFVMIGLN